MDGYNTSEDWQGHLTRTSYKDQGSLWQCDKGSFKLPVTWTSYKDIWHGHWAWWWHLGSQRQHDKGSFKIASEKDIVQGHGDITWVLRDSMTRAALDNKWQSHPTRTKQGHLTRTWWSHLWSQWGYVREAVNVKGNVVDTRLKMMRRIRRKSSPRVLESLAQDSLARESRKSS